MYLLLPMCWACQKYLTCIFRSSEAYYANRPFTAPKSLFEGEWTIFCSLDLAHPTVLPHSGRLPWSELAIAKSDTSRLFRSLILWNSSVQSTWLLLYSLPIPLQWCNKIWTTPSSYVGVTTRLLQTHLLLARKQSIYVYERRFYWFGSSCWILNI